jgi:ATP-dependent helicase HrpA
MNLPPSLNLPAELPLDAGLLGKLKANVENAVMSVDRYRLVNGLRQLKTSLDKGLKSDHHWVKWRSSVLQSNAKMMARIDNLPLFDYPDLPVSARADEIKELVQNNQVVIIAGETGSGKTTQIPKICLKAGRGVRGLIGHTQPRRIAARAVAERVSEELKSPLGVAAGYQVRFSDHTSADSYIKLMTDGILLAEIQRDRYLSRYDTIIVDEAHERSLNIDFLLGYLKTLLAKRNDLKVIITSATIDVEKFSQHFNNAPVVEVSGRTYPVEIIYSGLENNDTDRNQSILDCLLDIHHNHKLGDVLVFLSGEREIREANLALRRAQLPDTEIVPLYARLSLAEQRKIFSSHRGRRVILSTNVAETSLTVPGIRYVIDTGRARVSRYSYRTKVQRLPIESVSQASANQRAGRCGRVSDGICYRLYTEEDFNARAKFTDAEIVRTNLASVILQMSHLKIGDIRQFPFIDPPDSRLINDGYKLLQELQAVMADGKLTILGRQLVALPVDPRFARMIIEASGTGSLSELLIIVSGLSIQDPRERPGDKQQAADLAHTQWQDKDSDFISFVNLWRHFEQKRQSLSANQFSKYCRSQFVSYLRMREWRDLHHQLHNACRGLKLQENKQAADYGSIHRALLSGLLGQVGVREEKWEFTGTRNRKFFIFPGSGLSKKPPKWVMAASLMETSRLYALTVAKIDPSWLETLASHLVKKSHSEPFYHVKSGQVMARERQTLFGLTIVESKRVVFGAANPDRARGIFIQQALVEDGYRGKGQFYRSNQELVRELEALEDRFRRRDLVAEQEVIYHHYDKQIPSTVYNLPAFEKWRRGAEKVTPDTLLLNRDQLLLRSLTDREHAQFPNQLTFEGVNYEVRYHFEPGHVMDGVSVVIPMALLHQVPLYLFDWLVPGMLRDKCIALIKGLPKSIRRLLVPVPDFVDKLLTVTAAQDRPICEVLGEQLFKLTGHKIRLDDWQPELLEPWYQMNFILQDDHSQQIAVARSLGKLQRKFKQQISSGIAESAQQNLTVDGITRWDFGELPVEVLLPRGKINIKAWPALNDRVESVSLEVLDNPRVAEAMSINGQLRLAMLQSQDQTKYLMKNLLRGKDLQLKAAGLGSREILINAIIKSSFRQAFFTDNKVVRQQREFENLYSQGIGRVVPLAQQHAVAVETALPILHEQQQRLRQLPKNAHYAAEDIVNQVDYLFSETILSGADVSDTQQYARYLRAIDLRIDKLLLDVRKDQLYTQQIESFVHKLDHAEQYSDHLPLSIRVSLFQFQWLVQELRVSLFAQQLKTRTPVSTVRLEKRWDKIESEIQRYKLEV